MSKKPRKPGGGYLEQVISQALGKELKPGVQHVIVEHDKACPFLTGGECSCHPAITFTEGSA